MSDRALTVPGEDFQFVDEVRSEDDFEFVEETFPGDQDFQFVEEARSPEDFQFVDEVRTESDFQPRPDRDEVGSPWRVVTQDEFQQAQNEASARGTMIDEELQRAGLMPKWEDLVTQTLVDPNMDPVAKRELVSDMLIFRIANGQDAEWDRIAQQMPVGERALFLATAENRMLASRLLNIPDGDPRSEVLIHEMKAAGQIDDIQLTGALRDIITTSFLTHRANQAAFHAFVADMFGDEEDRARWMASAQRLEEMIPEMDPGRASIWEKILINLTQLGGSMAPHLAAGGITGAAFAAGSLARMLPAYGASQVALFATPIDEAAMLASAMASGGLGAMLGMTGSWLIEFTGQGYRGLQAMAVPIYEDADGNEIPPDVAQQLGITDPVRVEEVPRPVQMLGPVLLAGLMTGLDRLQLTRLFRGVPGLQRIFGDPAFRSALVKHGQQTFAAGVARQLRERGCSAIFAATIEGTQAFAEEQWRWVTARVSEMIANGEVEFDERTWGRVQAEAANAFFRDFGATISSFGILEGAKGVGSIVHVNVAQLSRSGRGGFDRVFGETRAIPTIPQEALTIALDPNPQAVQEAHRLINQARAGGDPIPRVPITFSDDQIVVRDDVDYPVDPSAMLVALREQGLEDIPVNQGASVIDQSYRARLDEAMRANRLSMGLDQENAAAQQRDSQAVADEAPAALTRGDYSWIIQADSEVEFTPGASSAEKLIQLQQQIWGDNPPSLEESLELARSELQFQFDARAADPNLDIGLTWYTDSIRRMRAALEVHFPNLGRDADWDMFRLITAVTSGGVRPDRNLQISVEVYDQWNQTGRVPDMSTAGKAFSLQAGANLRKLQQLLERFDGSSVELVQWLGQEGTKGDLAQYNSRLKTYLNVKNPETLAARQAESEPNFVALGDKFGRFYMNLMGGAGELTIDRWAWRTWQRWRGAMRPGGEGETIRGEKNIPSADRAAFEDMITQLSQEFGITTSEAQAVLWYYEKRLWTSLGLEREADNDYATVADNAARRYLGLEPAAGTGAAGAATEGRPDARVRAGPRSVGPLGTGRFTADSSDVDLNVVSNPDGGFRVVASDEFGAIRAWDFPTIDSAVAAISGEFTESGGPVGSPDYRFVSEEPSVDPDAVAAEIAAVNRSLGVDENREATHPGEVDVSSLPTDLEITTWEQNNRFSGDHPYTEGQWALQGEGDHASLYQLGRIRVDDIANAKFQPQGAYDNQVVGQFRAVLTKGGRNAPIWIEEQPDGSFEVVDGHHRLEASLRRGEVEVEAWIARRVPTGDIDENGNPVTVVMTPFAARSQLRGQTAEQFSGDAADLREAGTGPFTRQELPRGELEAIMAQLIGSRRFHGAGLQSDFWRMSQMSVQQGELTAEQYDEAMRLVNANPELYREVFQLLDQGDLDRQVATLLDMDLRDDVVADTMEAARGTIRDDIYNREQQRFSAIVQQAPESLQAQMTTDALIDSYIRKGGQKGAKARKLVRDYLQRVARDINKPVSGATDYWYKASIEFLQQALDPQFRSRMTVETREDIIRFLREGEFEKDLPKGFLRKVAQDPINQWTVEELLRMHSRVQELRLLGRLKYRERQAERRRRHNDNLAQVREAMGFPEGPPPQPPQDSAAEAAERPGAIQRAVQAERYYDLRPQRMLDRSDGARGEFSPNNPHFRVFHSQIAAAYDGVLNREDARLNPVNELIQSRVHPLGPGIYFGSNIGQKVGFPTLNREDIMSMYMLAKTETGAAAIQHGMGIDSGQMTELVGLLSDYDLSIADAILEDYRVNYPRVREALLRHRNRDMGFIPNYSPLSWVVTPGAADDLMSAELDAHGFWRQVVDDGFTKTRATFGDRVPGRVRLGAVSMWMESVRAHEYFMGMTDVHREAARLANDPEFQRMQELSFGPKVAQWYRLYADRIARPEYNLNAPQDPLSAISRHLRRNMAPTFLALNAITSAKQFPSVFFYLPESGMPQLLKAVSRATVMGQFSQMRDVAYQMDPRMRHRHIDRSIDELRTSSPNLYRSLLQKYGEVGMWAIYKMDEIATVTGWTAVYGRYKAKGYSDAEAAARARDATLRTQPASHVFDVAQMYMSDNELSRWALQFTNQLNQIHNIATYDIPARLFKGKESMPKRVAVAAEAIGALGLSSLIIWAANNRRMPEDEDDFKDILITGGAAMAPSWLSRAAMAFAGGYDAFDHPLNDLPETIRLWQSKPNSKHTRERILEAVGLTTGLVPALQINRLWEAFETQDAAELFGGVRN